MPPLFCPLQLGVCFSLGLDEICLEPSALEKSNKPDTGVGSALAKPVLLSATEKKKLLKGLDFFTPFLTNKLILARTVSANVPGTLAFLKGDRNSAEQIAWPFIFSW